MDKELTLTDSDPWSRTKLEAFTLAHEPGENVKMTLRVNDDREGTYMSFSLDGEAFDDLVKFGMYWFGYGGIGSVVETVIEDVSDVMKAAKDFIKDREPTEDELRIVRELVKARNA